MSYTITLEQEKTNFDNLISSKVSLFKKFLRNLDKSNFNKSDIEFEISANKNSLHKYIHKNFPIRESVFIDGQEYYHKTTAFNSILNLMLSQRYNEFEGLYQEFLKGL